MIDKLQAIREYMLLKSLLRKSLLTHYLPNTISVSIIYHESINIILCQSLKDLTSISGAFTGKISASFYHKIGRRDIRGLWFFR